MKFDEQAFKKSVGKRIEVVRTDRDTSRTQLGPARAAIPSNTTKKLPRR